MKTTQRKIANARYDGRRHAYLSSHHAMTEWGRIRRGNDGTEPSEAEYTAFLQGWMDAQKEVRR